MKQRIILLILLIFLNCLYYYNKNNEYKELLKYSSVSAETVPIYNDQIKMHNKILDFFLKYEHEIHLKSIVFSGRTTILFSSENDFGKIVENYWKNDYYSMKINFNRQNDVYIITF